MGRLRITIGAVALGALALSGCVKMPHGVTGTNEGCLPSNSDPVDYIGAKFFEANYELHKPVAFARADGTALISFDAGTQSTGEFRLFGYSYGYSGGLLSYHCVASRPVPAPTTSDTLYYYAPELPSGTTWHFSIVWSKPGVSGYITADAGTVTMP